MILNSFVALVATLFAFAPVFGGESVGAAIFTSTVSAAVAVLAVMSSGNRRYRAGVAAGGALLALGAFAFPPSVATIAGQLTVAYFFFAAGVAPEVKVSQPEEAVQELRRAA